MKPAPERHRRRARIGRDAEARPRGGIAVTVQGRAGATRTTTSPSSPGAGVTVVDQTRSAASGAGTRADMAPPLTSTSPAVNPVTASLKPNRTPNAALAGSGASLVIVTVGPVTDASTSSRRAGALPWPTPSRTAPAPTSTVTVPEKPASGAMDARHTRIETSARSPDAVPFPTTMVAELEPGHRLAEAEHRLERARHRLGRVAAISTAGGAASTSTVILAGASLLRDPDAF